jgi:hypothetical protein
MVVAVAVDVAAAGRRHLMPAIGRGRVVLEKVTTIVAHAMV